jgi:hypothetical protein
MGSGAGSNKIVANHGTGGAIQRRERPRQNTVPCFCCERVVLLVYSGSGMRFQPPPSTRDARLGARHVRPVTGLRALLSFVSAALPFPQPPARERSSMRAGTDLDENKRAEALPRLNARLEAIVGLQDNGQTQRSPGHRALRGSTGQCRAFSQGSRGRAKPARCRAQPLCTERGSRLLSHRMRAQRSAKFLSLVQIAQQCHGNAAQRERRRIAQRGSLQRP